MMRAVESLQELMEIAIEQGASDIHLTAGLPPILRIFGSIKWIESFERLLPTDIERLIENTFEKNHIETLRKVGEVDFSYGVTGLGRFRCNLSRQRSAVSVAMRVINSDVKSLEQLGLPPILHDIARLRNGLILVTGPTGSGKSTTLASMIDIINKERQGVIITLEDPIEFLHSHKNCLVNQREVGTDTQSFANGLRAALRSDPDIILVGEMRDLETIQIALTAAETGHLVLSSLHTRGSAKTIDRVIDAFPAESQQQIRIQLSGVLEAVVSQQLFPDQFGRGMVPAVEVMLGTPAIRNMIREEKVHQIPSMIETGTRFGMQTLDSAIEKLVNQGVIDRSALYSREQYAK